MIRIGWLPFASITICACLYVRKRVCLFESVYIGDANEFSIPLLSMEKVIALHRASEYLISCVLLGSRGYPITDTEGFWNSFCFNGVTS